MLNSAPAERTAWSIYIHLNLQATTPLWQEGLFVTAPLVGLSCYVAEVVSHIKTPPTRTILMSNDAFSSSHLLSGKGETVWKRETCRENRDTRKEDSRYPVLFFLCNMCHWQSCGKKLSDLAWAQSSLSKIIRQTTFVCLRTSSGFPSGKSCCVRHLLAKYWLTGASSNHRSVCSHWYSSSEEDTNRWDFSFDVTSPFSRKRRLLYMSGRWHTSRRKSDSTTKQQAISRHGARDCFSQHIAIVCDTWIIIP